MFERAPDPADYIDLARYPIDRRDAPQYRALLADITEDIQLRGCAVIQNFIRADVISALVAEAERVAPLAHRSFSRTNVYFTQDDESLPAAHPARRFFDRSNAFVPADNLGADSILRAIYEWQPFFDFAQEALGERDFYRYADPLADIVVNVTAPGGGFPWHFDTNNFTVTLAIRNGERGGDFEYSPYVRGAEDENYDAVRAILDGERTGVFALPLRPGDLQLFKGRYTLHRVSEVGGARDRYVAIFSYAARPGVVASPERCRQLYGRVLPIHYQQAQNRPDTLID